METKSVLIQANGKPVTVIDGPLRPKAGGVSLDEAKAHVAQANLARPLGIGWDEIWRKQGNKPRKLNVAKLRAMGRPCPQCGKPSKSTCLLPLCKKCAAKL